MLQELSILQDCGDTAGECRAHGNLGAVHMSLSNNTLALRCFQEQLDRAQELKDAAGEAAAFGNMGITRMNLSHFEEAIQNFEQQLGCLDHAQPKAQLKEKARVFGNLGDCYDALGNLQESVKLHEQFLGLALKCAGPRDQDRAYRGLGLAHKNLGNLQEALVSQSSSDHRNSGSRAASSAPPGRPHTARNPTTHQKANLPTPVRCVAALAGGRTRLC